MNLSNLSSPLTNKGWIKAEDKLSFVDLEMSSPFRGSSDSEDVIQIEDDFTPILFSKNVVGDESPVDTPIYHQSWFGNNPKVLENSNLEKNDVKNMISLPDDLSMLLNEAAKKVYRKHSVPEVESRSTKFHTQTLNHPSYSIVKFGENSRKSIGCIQNEQEDTPITYLSPERLMKKKSITSQCQKSTKLVPNVFWENEDDSKNMPVLNEGLLLTFNDCE